LSFALSKDESATRKVVEARPYDHDHRKIKTELKSQLGLYRHYVSLQKYIRLQLLPIC